MAPNKPFPSRFCKDNVKPMQRKNRFEFPSPFLLNPVTPYKQTLSARFLKPPKNRFELRPILSSSPEARDGTGYFEYNDFLFVWHGDLPPSLYERTGEKRKFTYQQYVPIIKCDWGDFYFKYSRGKMEITGLGCW